MAFEYSKLSGIITEKFGTQYNFARAMQLSEHSVSRKLNNQIPWKQTEIARAIELLGLTKDDVGDYFFVSKVQSV